jgi:hypothetical protein
MSEEQSISNIFFRAQSENLDRNNLYWVRLDSREMYSGFHLFRNVDGTEQNIVTREFSVQNNFWHTIKVEFIGNSIVGYLNGEEQFRVMDDSFSSGFWGLDVETPTIGEVHFIPNCISVYLTE